MSEREAEFVVDSIYECLNLPLPTKVWFDSPRPAVQAVLNLPADQDIGKTVWEFIASFVKERAKKLDREPLRAEIQKIIYSSHVRKAYKSVLEDLSKTDSIHELMGNDSYPFQFMMKLMSSDNAIGYPSGMKCVDWWWAFEDTVILVRSPKIDSNESERVLTYPDGSVFNVKK